MRWEFGDDRELDSEEFLDFRNHKEALYDGAIAYVDAMLGKFMQELDDLGVAEQTIVVITSDHGEELWDSPDFGVKFDHHPKQEGGVGHGHSMLAEILDVPLILHGPGVPTGRPAQQVSHLDIAPTVLGLLGLRPTDGMLGVDLLAALRNGTLEDRPVFSEDMAYGYDAKALQEGGYKYIRYLDHPEQPAFLFDQREDPEERTNLVEQDPQLAATYDRRLRELMALHPSRQGGVAVPSPEELERLKALGYLD